MPESKATYSNCRKNYGGLMPSEMKQLKKLEEENHRLKKLVADLNVDREMLQDVIRRKISGLPGSGRWSITCAVWQVAIRRACCALPVDVPLRCN